MNIGLYHIIKSIGSGGFGNVYEVEKDGVHYALKTCSQYDRDSICRFDREIRITNDISNSHIVQITYYDISSNPPYYVMELCDNSLNDIVENLSDEQKVSYIVQACEGIKLLHTNGIIHRDIKPANFLLSGCIVKVSDFGLSRKMNSDSETLTDSNNGIGSLGYIAPEISDNLHNATIESDIFALGGVIYYTFSNGCRPDLYNPNQVTPNIARIVEKCRSINPKDRYHTIEEIISDISQIKALSDFISVSELMGKKQTIDDLKYKKYALEFILMCESWQNLVKTLRELQKELKSIIIAYPDACSNILQTIENNSNSEEWKQYEDAEIITACCLTIYLNTTDISIKQKAIEISLPLSIELNRFDAMKDVAKMLGKLTDKEIRSMSIFLRDSKDDIVSCYDTLGCKLPISLNILLQENK